MRATKYTRSKVETRLSGCAALVRAVVEVGLRKLRYKTVKAIVEHIVQTLPSADGSYCAPLCKDYFKSLATLFEFQSHCEHFRENEWHDAVDFCLETLRELSKGDEVNGSSSSNPGKNYHGSSARRDTPSRSGTPGTLGDRALILNASASQPSTRVQLRDSQYEVAHCLQRLSSVPNAPISERAHEIVATVVNLLDSYSRIASIQHALFGCINSILAHVISNDLGFAIEIVVQVLPFLRRLWDVKDNTMKEPILAFLSHAEILLPRLILEDSTGDVKSQLTALNETLRIDYTTRKPREQLEIDDIILLDPTCCCSPGMPLSSKSIQSRTGVFKAEHPWCLISYTAAVTVALENDIVERESKVQSREDDYPLKRQKFSHPLNDLQSAIRSSERSAKLYVLQVLTFVFDMFEFQEVNLEVHLNTLIPCLSDDDGPIASWAMICMAS